MAKARKRAKVDDRRPEHTATGHELRVEHPGRPKHVGVLADVVAHRAAVCKVPRGTAGGGGHPQRSQDAPLQHLLVVAAVEACHELAEQVEAEIAVLAGAGRRYRDPHAAERREHLLAAQFSGSREIGARVLPLQARLVRQEAADGHVLDGAEGIGDRGELGKVDDQGVVEAQASLIAELHDTDRREDLGVGGDAVQRVGVRSTRHGEVGEAGGSRPC